MTNGTDFTHFDPSGRAHMVDIGDKSSSKRRALAEGFVLINAKTAALIKSGGFKKGDVLAIAQLAGIMGAKQTAQLIPLCHPLMLSAVSVRLELREDAVRIQAEVAVDHKTGVEMEALTAVSVAALCVYDMCKAVQKDMQITQVRLLEKQGGRSQDFQNVF